MTFIEDYALIGDCETAALVSREGSIDWLCFPRFDSRACFAALLGTPDHGRWLLTPSEPVLSVRRRYRGDTVILETEFTTAEGVVAVLDFMPVRSCLPDVIRIVVGRRGRVSMQMDLVIRFDYGSVVPWVRRVPGGISAVGGPDSLLLQTPVKQATAMTGEITLRGKVLPVGGIKEKLLAAGRAGITTLILPRHNEKDLVEVPRSTLDKLHIVFVDEIRDAITAALGR